MAKKISIQVKIKVIQIVIAIVLMTKVSQKVAKVNRNIKLLKISRKKLEREKKL